MQRNILNATDQIAERRMRLRDDAATAVMAILRDQNVDLITIERTARSQVFRFALAIFAFDDEHRDILN